jgi:hypothetical protein
LSNMEMVKKSHLATVCPNVGHLSHGHQLNN